jgi:hypothetical protein
LSGFLTVVFLGLTNAFADEKLVESVVVSFPQSGWLAIFEENGRAMLQFGSGPEDNIPAPLGTISLSKVVQLLKPTKTNPSPDVSPYISIGRRGEIEGELFFAEDTSAPSSLIREVLSKARIQNIGRIRSLLEANPLPGVPEALTLIDLKPELPKVVPNQSSPAKDVPTDVKAPSRDFPPKRPTTPNSLPPAASSVASSQEMFWQKLIFFTLVAVACVAYFSRKERSEK